jgi:predicted nucleic acid-binding protein
MKTYVFDAGALFAFLRKSPGAPKINEVIKEAVRGRARVLMSAVNFGEVYGLILRASGPERARRAVHAVSSLPIEVVEATAQRACTAAEVKAKYKLYYVDSFAAALATEHHATLVTGDSDFRKLGHSVPVVWLRV